VHGPVVRRRARPSAVIDPRSASHSERPIRSSCSVRGAGCSDSAGHEAGESVLIQVVGASVAHFPTAGCARRAFAVPR
jgi:hypothetical protein